MMIIKYHSSAAAPTKEEYLIGFTNKISAIWRPYRQRKHEAVSSVINLQCLETICPTIHQCTCALDSKHPYIYSEIFRCTAAFLSFNRLTGIYNSCSTRKKSRVTNVTLDLSSRNLISNGILV